MSERFPKVLAFLLAALLGGCQSPPERSSDALQSAPYAAGEAARAWEGAYSFIAIDGEVLEGALAAPALGGRLRRLAAGSAYPIVLYLHGCDGLHPRAQRAFWRSLARAGFAVLMPDSFARTGRRAECGAQRSQIYAARLAEIDYALGRLARYPWVDRHRIVLYGHSEGGVAVSRYAGSEVRGAIIASANCRRYALSVPSLAIHFRGDRGVAGAGCERADGQLVLPGDGHEVLEHELGRQRVTAFLEEVTR